ncbi:hypothetical protein [Azonexus hydrophilus]|uniref:Phage protein n=1 Tax=Azonexus hydrophilus TaxID=418702 RepID=A0ABZ2XKX5_9RHOO
MKAQRTYKFRTKANGTVTIREHTFDDAMEAFLRQGYLETDIVEIC